jgi:small subunit ribosomal protein S20
MNKKQKNRKVVTQNKRNRMINRRYSSTIKTLVKLFNKTVKNGSLEEKPEINLIQSRSIANNLYSVIDKAVKKGILHKNTAARKKSKMEKTLKHNIKFLDNSLKI